jgi:hypothetical protein
MFEVNQQVDGRYARKSDNYVNTNSGRFHRSWVVSWLTHTNKIRDVMFFTLLTKDFDQKTRKNQEKKVQKKNLHIKMNVGVTRSVEDEKFKWSMLDQGGRVRKGGHDSSKL